jgi:hypothetical protein
VLHTCPVRELDPEAEFYIAWMLATHRETDRGWELMQLPGPGGIANQDALLMEGIAAARSAANAYRAEQLRARARAQDVSAFFDRQAAEAAQA